MLCYCHSYIPSGLGCVGIEEKTFPVPTTYAVQQVRSAQNPHPAVTESDKMC
jgi:hypothetical protein